MLRFYLKPAICCLFLFALPLLLIHSQPYNDHDLRALLMPEGCKMPCFMGIRPGMTTMDEAVKVLNTSDWTSNLETISDEKGQLNSLTWNWTDAAPTIFDHKITAEIEANYPGMQSIPIVENIQLDITVHVGELYLLWGEPDATDSGPPGFTNENVAFVSALYLSKGLYIGTIVHCPVTEERFWNTPMTFEIMSAQSASYTTGWSYINYWC